MRVQKRIPWLMSLGAVLAAMALGTTQAQADVISDRPGSVVIWPKVIADGTRDTLIALTNTSNLTAYAHCEYVVGTGVCSLVVPGEPSARYCSTIQGDGCPEIPGGSPNLCNIEWQTGDFDVVLTRQQPTIWRVSTGRIEDLFLPRNGQCTTFVQDGTLRESCPGFFQVGMVPPPPQAPLPGLGTDDPAFRGELRCIQIDGTSGNAYAGNALKGEAIIETLGSNDISKYNSINIQGIAGVDALDSPDVIELNGIGYNACPESVEFTTYAVNATDISAVDLGVPCATSDCAVRTEITLAPCRANFITEEGAPFNVHFETWNEFEQSVATQDVPFDCWANVTYEDLGFAPSVPGSTIFHTRAESSGSGLCIAGENEGIIGCTSDTTPPNLGRRCTIAGTQCRSNVDCPPGDICGPSGIAGCGAGGVCAPISGILAIVEEFHTTDNSIGEFTGVGSDAANTYSVDSDLNGSIQRLGRCRNALTTQCGCQLISPPPAPGQCSQLVVDDQCPTGRCRLNSTKPCDADADCSGRNADCTAAGQPALCCTGMGTGTCTGTPGDFCDRCMNDEITFDADGIVLP